MEDNNRIIEEGITEYTRTVNRHFRKRDDVVENEELLLHLIHSREVLWEILSQ